MKKELKPVLRRAFETLPYSVEIMAHVQTKMKNELLRCGAGFPVIVLYGSPANGKTSTIRACLTEKDSVIKFAEGLKVIKKKFCENEGDTIKVIDNYPRFLSHYKHEGSLRILDYVIDLASENSNVPSVILTAEHNIFDDLTKAPSLMERTLLVEVPKIDQNTELSEIRSYLTENREEYLSMMCEFDKWFENVNYQKNMAKELEQFRRKYRNYEHRCVGLVFSYYYACRIFSIFLDQQYRISLDWRIIDDNVEQLFNGKEHPEKLQISIVKEVWDMLVENEAAFKVTEPREHVCECLFSKEKCYRCNVYGYYDKSYHCFRCDEDVKENYYHLMDMCIQSDITNETIPVILIKDVRLIKYFPKHVKCDSPLLMVRNEDLYAAMNMCLEAYARSKDTSMMPFAPKKMNRDLFLHNLCLFEYVGTNHNTYTFRMKDTEDEDIRVIFMKLTEQQYETLHQRVKEPESDPYSGYDRRKVINMQECLKRFCENAQSLIGEVGTPSKIYEE